MERKAVMGGREKKNVRDGQRITEQWRACTETRPCKIRGWLERNQVF